MNTQYVTNETRGRSLTCDGRIGDLSSWNEQSSVLLSAAKARLKAAATGTRQRRESSNGDDYYGGWGDEEPIEDDPGRRNMAGIVTRNHYGCLVLNASRSLFIDVDLPAPSAEFLTAGERRQRWQEIGASILNDLRIVLTDEKEEGFRIYRTAAGFRILATSHEFEPGSERSRQLMEAAGADSDFVKLCSLQKNFRARLTPKPWRCGMKRPPRSFPLASADEKRCFSDWLSQYERACLDRATCQFLEQIGPALIHDRVAPIIAVHDRETKAMETLPLA